MADAEKETLQGAEAPLPPGFVRQEEDHSSSPVPQPPRQPDEELEESPLIPPAAAPADEPGATRDLTRAACERARQKRRGPPTPAPPMPRRLGTQGRRFQADVCGGSLDRR